MSIRRLSVLSLAVLALWPLAAEAQVITARSGPTAACSAAAGPRPEPVRQELTLHVQRPRRLRRQRCRRRRHRRASTALTPDGAGYTGTSTPPVLPRRPAAKSFALDFGAGTSAYRQRRFDPSQSVHAERHRPHDASAPGRRFASENLSYSSQLRLDAPLTDGIPVGDVPTDDSAIFGLGPRASVNSTTSAGVEQQISRDASVTGTYGYTTTAFTEGDTGGYRAHRASARYSHQVGRWTEATGTVRRTAPPATASASATKAGR